MAPSTPLRSLATTTDEGNRHHNYNCSDDNENDNCDEGFALDEIDLDSLQRVFGSSSHEEFHNRKAHELRELWLAKTNETKASRSMPRFLLDPKNKDHVPPHAVALQLLLRRSTRRAGNGDGLYRRVPGSDAGETENDRSDRDSEERLPNDEREAEEEEGPPSVGPVLGIILVWVALVALVCQFVLEVLGGAGAIWGCAELVRLRKGGPVDPSWWVTTVAAIAVGTACLVRFLLVHPFLVGDTHPTFAQKHKLRTLLLRNNGLAIELIRIVASDPVLFLHPTKGLALVSVCCCYCVCVRPGVATMTGGNPPRSPASLGKDAPSPQRSTWDLSDDDDEEEDDDDNNNGEYGFDALAGP